MRARRPRLTIAGTTSVVAVFAALGVALGALGSRCWLLDLCADATAQGACALLAATLLLALLARWRWCAALLPFLLLAALRTLPLFAAAAPCALPIAAATASAPLRAPTAAAGRPVRLATFNLLEDNRDFAAVLAACRREPFDVVGVSEMTADWERALAALGDELPHHVGRAAGVFGIGLWSRHPLRDAQVIPLGFTWAPAITAIVDAPQGAFSVLVAHTPRPGFTGQRMTDERDRALAAIPGVLAALPPPRVLLGDLNATRWSAAYGAMLAQSGLCDTADGAGWQPTWPTDLPSLLRIPIDQVLVEPTIGLRRRRLGPFVSSDHLPVFVELRLPP